MPSLTITITNAQFARLMPAIESVTPHNPSDTNSEVAIKWIRRMAANTVFEYERNQALDEIVPDPDIVDQPV